MSKLGQKDMSALNVDDYVPYYIMTISYRMSRSAAREFPRRFGLNQADWVVLAAIASEPHATATEISAKHSLDKAAISRSVCRLEDKGFLISEGVNDHNRKRLLDLTSKGRSVYQEMAEFVLQRERSLLDGMSRDEVEMLLLLLKKIKKNSDIFD